MKLINDTGHLINPKGFQICNILNQIGGPGGGRRGFHHALLLLEGSAKDLGDDCCKIVAMLSVKKIFVIPRNNRYEAIRLHKKFLTMEGDLLGLINVFDAYHEIPSNRNSKSKFCRENYLHELGLQQAELIYERLVQVLKNSKLPVTKTIDGAQDTENLLSAIASAYFLNSAYLHHDGYYYTIREKTKLKLHQDCCLFGLDPAPKFITFGDTTEASYQEAVDIQKRVYKTDNHERLFLVKEVTAFGDFRVLQEAAPHYFVYD